MEFEDIIKRVEWLDEQQRKGKTDLTELNSRSASIESGLNVLTQQLKSLSQQMNDISLAAARMNQFDQIMTKQRADMGSMLDTSDKNALRREQESAKLHQADLEEIRKVLFPVSNAVKAEEAAKKDRAHEEQRRTLTVQDTRAAVDAVVRQGQEILAAQKALDDTHRQDSKRLADLQAELASVRKRADEAREKTTLNSDAIRNIETRINELAETETNRQERYAALLQQQALAQVERDRAWKDWQEKYGVFKQQAAGAEGQVAAFEESIRSAHRAQEAYDGLNQKLERRIAEVGEIQRLAEDRMRQEWVAFKAEEQKRWAGHALAQEESLRDLRKDVDKTEKRLTAVDDAAQSLLDQVHQTTDTTEKQLQELMNVAQEWLSSYERIMGHGKTKAQKATR
jgi:chromosome segregation ATPase